MAETLPALVDRFGRPLTRPELDKAVLTREVAGPTLTGVRTPMTGDPSGGLNPCRLAAILREADGGQPLRYFELAEAIEEKDLHYAGVLGTRKRSIAQLEITVEAAGDKPEQVKAADRIRAWLTRDELQDELFHILDAIGKGISFTEIVWDTSSGSWEPKRLEWRDPRWFAFSRLDGRTPLLRGGAEGSAAEGSGSDEPLPAAKFIVACIAAKSGLPIRSGIARLAAWAWMFKAFTQRDWAIFSQTYGQPIRVGKYHAAATEADKDTLFRAVANIAGDCAAIIPEAMLIEFVQSANVAASADLYLQRANWLDQQVSKGVLGQTATTDAIAGGHAVGREHRQVQEDIKRADAKVLAAVLNRDVIRPWVDLEWGPPADGAYPRLLIGRAEQRDVELVINAVDKMVRLGMRVQASELRDMLGLSDPDEGAELLVAPKPEPAPGADEAGEDVDPATGEPPADSERRRSLHAAEAGHRTGGGRPVDVVDLLAGQAAALAAPAEDAAIDAIRAAVEAAADLADLRDRLGVLELSPADFAEAMGRSLAMAELLGRSEIVGEIAAGASEPSGAQG